MKRAKARRPPRPGAESASFLQRWTLLVCGGPVALQVARIILRGERPDSSAMIELAAVSVVCLILYAAPRQGLPLAIAAMFVVGVKQLMFAIMGLDLWPVWEGFGNAPFWVVGAGYLFIASELASESALRRFLLERSV